jgi:hypothetical protein
MRKAIGWPLLIIASSLVLAAQAIVDIGGPVRTVAALWFLLVCTGMSFLPLLDIELSPPMRLALAAVISIVLDTVVVTALTLAGRLSETSSLLALAGICLIGCALQLLAAPVPQGSDPRDRLDGQPAPGAHEPISSPQG